MRIGWIGLGGIGVEMVKRLLAEGHEVCAYPRGKGLDEAVAAGARTNGDYAALAADCEALILCVYSDAQLREVLFEKGALAALRPGAVAAIHTTGSPELSREIAERAPAGVGVLEACFSGGPADVAAGRLTLLVGGEAETLEKVRPAFSTYASQIHHVGAVGQGQKLKLLNNLLFATNLMNSVELLRLAKDQGFETATAARVIQACSGASYTMNLFQSGAAPDSLLAGARHYMEKDVAAARDAARELGLDVSAFASTIAYFQPKA
jgi:3-hydroxyisobutyrate dehydrogenase-like beta-hydroxyacid dehydrogenase